MSPSQDQEEQRKVVWSRLHSHQANLAGRLSKQKECYLALCQELNPRTTQVESSHKLLFHDIKSNLPTASRAEKVFQEGVPLNRRGERNVPKKYLKSALYTKGDEEGYFVYHNGTYLTVEFDFTHCFWYTVKYNNQKSCWVTYSIPKPELGRDIPDSEVTDRSEWGPIDNGDSSEEEEETKSEGHPESIDIKIPTKEEERTERQLEKLAEQFPILSRPRSHTASSRLPPITTIMATQTTTEPTQVMSTKEGTSSAQRGGGPPGDAPWFSGSGFPYRAHGGGGRDDGDSRDNGGGGGPPGAARVGRNPDNRNNGMKLSGKEPVIFDRDCSKAEAFLLEWTIYRLLNGEQDIM